MNEGKIKERVIIGIVSKHFEKEEKRTNLFIRDEVKQAIFDNGAVAIGIILPKNEKNNIESKNDKWNNNLTPIEYDNLISQIELCDGIVFQGGAACDNYEMIVAKYCYDNDIPTLGICCGQNVLVRALGGTTYKIPNPEEQNLPDQHYVHNLTIDKASKFFNIVKKESIMVNSRHTRDIDKCPLLDKVGFSTEGYAEVVESKNKKFYIGVRFHPESLYKIDKNINYIFESFIECCKNRYEK